MMLWAIGIGVILSYLCGKYVVGKVKQYLHTYPNPAVRQANKKHRRSLLSKDKQKIRRTESCQQTKEQKMEKFHERRMNDTFRSFTRVKAPEIFSMISNAEESLSFVTKLEECFDKRRKVFVDLKSVKHIGNGAIVVLLSKMIQFKSHDIDFNGNYPKNKQCYKILKESGFIENLYKNFGQEEEYGIGNENNKIYTHGQKNVNPVLSSEIIRHMSKQIWGDSQRCIGVQRVFLELMQNTNNHASFNKFGEKHWWLSVDYDKETNTSHIAFIDFGVGIFKSLENKNNGSKFYGVIEKLKNAVRYGSNADLLKLLLEGEVHKTATGDYYRGKGLPGIVNAFNKNQISNLIIISNNAMADLKENRYTSLTNPLSGSFFYWEVNHNNEHFAA